MEPASELMRKPGPLLPVWELVRDRAWELWWRKTASPEHLALELVLELTWELLRAGPQLPLSSLPP